MFGDAAPHRISHKESFISHAGRFAKGYAGSDDDDKLETASKFSDDKDVASPAANKVNLLPSGKRWANRRGSREEGYEYEQPRNADHSTALSPGRRQSVTSSRSRATNEDHEMRQLNDGPLARADSVLGNEGTSPDGRFVHPVDDAITEEARDADLRSVSSIDVAEKETAYPPASGASPYMPQSNVRALNEASAAAFGQSRPAARPSTAPANVIRRELNFLRPSSSGAGQSQQQQRAGTGHRQRRNRTAVGHDEGSQIARLQSDGWHTRQIQSLERSPAGTALLGAADDKLDASAAPWAMYARVSCSVPIVPAWAMMCTNATSKCRRVIHPKVLLPSAKLQRHPSEDAVLTLQTLPDPLFSLTTSPRRQLTQTDRHERLCK
ncbi:hypothetical protein L1887_54837 [Cichorium endivia]|nr:hypothetical protein L1887_54837 [Cichorium endivia]